MIIPNPRGSADPRTTTRSPARRYAGSRLATIGLLLAGAALLAVSPGTASAQGWIDPLPRATDWGVSRAPFRSPF